MQPETERQELFAALRKEKLILVIAGYLPANLDSKSAVLAAALAKFDSTPLATVVFIAFRYH
jgi:hypothetical protein